MLNLAKYDQNFDVRDKSRLVRAVLFSQETVRLISSFHHLCTSHRFQSPKLSALSKRILMTKKPPPPASQEAISGSVAGYFLLHHFSPLLLTLSSALPLSLSLSLSG